MKRMTIHAWFLILLIDISLFGSNESSSHPTASSPIARRRSVSSARSSRAAVPPPIRRERKQSRTSMGSHSQPTRNSTAASNGESGNVLSPKPEKTRPINDEEMMQAIKMVPDIELENEFGPMDHHSVNINIYTAPNKVFTVELTVDYKESMNLFNLLDEITKRRNGSRPPNEHVTATAGVWLLDIEFMKRPPACNSVLTAQMSLQMWTKTDRCVSITYTRSSDTILISFAFFSASSAGYTGRCRIPRSVKFLPSEYVSNCFATVLPLRCLRSDFTLETVRWHVVTPSTGQTEVVETPMEAIYKHFNNQLSTYIMIHVFDNRP